MTGFQIVTASGGDPVSERQSGRGEGDSGEILKFLKHGVIALADRKYEQGRSVTRLSIGNRELDQHRTRADRKGRQGDPGICINGVRLVRQWRSELSVSELLPAR